MRAGAWGHPPGEGVGCNANCNRGEGFPLPQKNRLLLQFNSGFFQFRIAFSEMFVIQKSH